MKIAVIGGGPAGLTAAYQLAKELGKKVESLDLYEASEVVGGMSRSIQLWDKTVDLGPHRFFSKEKKINDLWLEVLNEEYAIVDRKTRILYNNTFFNYPLSVLNALSGLGMKEAFLCFTSYIVQRIHPVKDSGSFESWVTRKFGKRLYLIFFKTYSEKLWGIPCTELDSDFASQRIKQFSLREALKHMLIPSRANKHATLVQKFAYPLKGSGDLYEKMMHAIILKGATIHLNTPVKKIIVENDTATGLILEKGETKKYDHIISTMPLTHLIAGIDHLPASIRTNTEKLKFRNTILVYLHIDNPSLFSDQWLYIHDSKVETGRITNFRSWVPELYGNSNQTILCMEYWCNFEDELWKSKDAHIAELAKKEIQLISLAKASEILDYAIVRLPRCYPVYFKGYRQILDPLRDFLKNIGNLHVIGRYGAYKYNNQDHSILMGILAAENIALELKHDLWEINTDYGTYQEAASITKTGLLSSEGNY